MDGVGMDGGEKTCVWMGMDNGCGWRWMVMDEGGDGDGCRLDASMHMEMNVGGD